MNKTRLETVNMASGRMKLFVDDVRFPPDDSWLIARTASEAIAMLKAFSFDEISLDHDLGPEENGTGYDVAVWIEDCAAERLWQHVPANIYIHSANPVGIEKMRAAIVSIDKKRLAS